MSVCVGRFLFGTIVAVLLISQESTQKAEIKIEILQIGDKLAFLSPMERFQIQKLHFIAVDSNSQPFANN